MTSDSFSIWVMMCWTGYVSGVWISRYTSYNATIFDINTCVMIIVTLKSADTKPCFRYFFYGIPNLPSLAALCREKQPWYQHMRAVLGIWIKCVHPYDKFSQLSPKPFLSPAVKCQWMQYPVYTLLWPHVLRRSIPCFIRCRKIIEDPWLCVKIIMFTGKIIRI